MTPKEKQETVPELVYPVYLNVPMMTSFIAAVEDGVAFESDRTTNSKEGREKTTTAEGGFKLGEALAGLLGIDMKGQLAQKSNVMEEAAVKVLRRHTEASLFIKFRQFLVNSDRLLSIDYANEEQCTKLQRGQFIEVSGVLRRDFIQDAIGLFEQMMPYVDTNAKMANNKNNQSQARGNNRQSAQVKAVSQGQNMQAEQTIQAQIMIQTIKTDLANSSVQDMLLVSNTELDGKAISIIVPLLKSHITDSNFEGVRFSELTVLGKIVAVNLEGTQSANLLRRSALGFMTQDKLDPLFSASEEMYKVLNPDAPNLNVATIAPPWIEIIPIALYI